MRFTRKTTLVSAATLWVMLFFIPGMMGLAAAQEYPKQVVRILTSEPGGAGDLTSRLLAQGLTAALSQSVIVDNRAGIIAPEVVSKASPDGYTLLGYGSSFWLGPLLQKMPYDPVRDFAPVASASTQPNFLVVHPSLPVSSVKDLIALARARPGELNYAAAAVGSQPHLAGEYFKMAAKVNLVGVPYKAAGPALNDLLGGQVQVMFASAASVLPHIKSGRLKALAVTTARPSILMPSLPTVAETIPGYESASIQGIWAPMGTPASIIKRLNQEIVRIVNNPEVKEKLLNIGAEPASATPEEFDSIIKADMTRTAKIIQEAGIKVQ